MDPLMQFIEDSLHWNEATRGVEVMRFASRALQQYFGIDAGFYLFRKSENRVDIHAGAWGLHAPWGTFSDVLPQSYRFDDDDVTPERIMRFVGQWIRVSDAETDFRIAFPAFPDFLCRTEVRQVAVLPLRKNDGAVPGFMVVASVTDLPMPSLEVLSICACQIVVFLDMIRTRAQSEIMSAVLDHSVDPFCIFDPSGIVVRLNLACERTLGWVSASFVGATIPDESLMNDFLSFVRDTRTGVTSRQTHGVVSRPDGSPCPITVTWLGIFRSTGELYLVAAVIKDESRIKELHESLDEAQDMYESLFDHSADAIAVLSPSGLVDRVNSAYERMVGWSASEVVGQVPPSIPLDQMGDFQEDLSRVVLDGQAIVDRRTTQVTKDGRRLQVSTSMSPIISHHGHLHAVSLIIRDVSTEVEAQEQLRIADKLALAGTLAASVAHEIRNPLTTVKGFLQLLKSDFSDRNRAYDLMESELLQVEQVITEFLHLAKPTPVEAQVVDIQTMLSELIILMYPECTMHNVVLELSDECEEHHARANCDAAALKQVFVNLVKNAVEALNGCSDGRLFIQLLCDESANEVVVRFVDNGPGMTKSQLERVGEPFYTTKEKGTGLGLMVCKRILSNIGGRLQVHSALGQGTTMTVRLPRVTNLPVVI